MSDIRENSAVLDWFENSGELFVALKDEFDLPDSWVFSLAEPDVVPSDSDPEDLGDLHGSAAFMLRRVQALRALIAGDYENPARLMMGYSSDLYAFLSKLTSEGLVKNPLHEQVLIAGAVKTDNLLTASINHTV